MAKPIFVTLTSPSAAGKSYLLNYIRNVAKLPCLTSTTTRAPRKGEVEGQDYYFITEQQSIEMEKANLFAELAIYNGVRYGVTKQEFHHKLHEDAIVFLIVEPTGIDHYVKPALDVGAISYKAYIHTDPQVRLARFRKRAEADMRQTILQLEIDAKSGRPSPPSSVLKEFNTSLNRLTTMLTVEMQWGTAQPWDRILMGDTPPEENLRIILADIDKIRAAEKEVNEWKASKTVEA